MFVFLVTVFFICFYSRNEDTEPEAEEEEEATFTV